MPARSLRKATSSIRAFAPYLLNVAVLDRDFDRRPSPSTAFAILNGHGLVLPWYLWIALRRALSWSSALRKTSAAKPILQSTTRISRSC